MEIFEEKAEKLNQKQNYTKLLAAYEKLISEFKRNNSPQLMVEMIEENDEDDRFFLARSPVVKFFQLSVEKAINSNRKNYLQ